MGNHVNIWITSSNKSCKEINANLMKKLDDDDLLTVFYLKNGLAATVNFPIEFTKIIQEINLKK